MSRSAASWAEELERTGRLGTAVPAASPLHRIAADLKRLAGAPDTGPSRCIASAVPAGSHLVAEFIVPGPVRGKGRPRFGQGRTYTDAATLAYEAKVKTAATAAMQGEAPAAGPLKVLVTAYVEVPKSYAKRRREGCLAGLAWPTGRPDADNIIKCLDACNGVLWRDDAQVVEATVRKVWAEVPSLHVVVEAL